MSDLAFIGLLVLALIVIMAFMAVTGLPIA